MHVSKFINMTTEKTPSDDEVCVIWLKAPEKSCVKKVELGLFPRRRIDVFLDQPFINFY